MTLTLSSIDIKYLVKELKEKIEGSYTDKIYQGKEEKTDVLIKMRNPKTGKQQLYIRVPEAIFLTKHKYEWPKQPPGFAMKLRKELTNSKLTSIEQEGNERIITINFEKGEKKWYLIIELFSKGNIILADNNKKIRGIMKLQRWKDRTLRVNNQYELPPAKKNVFEMNDEEIKKELEKGEKEKTMVKILATNLGLGGKYSEEIITRANVNKEKEKTSEEEKEKIITTIKEIIKQPIKPRSLKENKEEISPIIMKQWEGKEQEEHNTFSEAIEQAIIKQKKEQITTEAQNTEKKIKNKYQKIIEEQTKKLNQYKKEAELNKRKGEIIYEHYNELKELITRIKEAKEKGGWEEAKKIIKGMPIKINEKQGTITITIKEPEEK